MRILGLLLCLSLGGCGIAAKMEARDDYRQSEDAYKTCLRSNQATPQNCEGYRLAMEADERKFTSMSAGAGGLQSSHNITVLNR